MRIIVPAFLSEAEDFWLSKDGIKLLSRWMGRLASQDFDVLVAGDASPLLDLAQKKGLTVMHCHASDTLEPFPAGLNGIIPHLIGRDEQTPPFAALNFRSPLLRSRTLAAALKAGKQATAPMGTVSTLVDHMPQCRSFWELVQADFLLLADMSQNHGEYVASRPFQAEALSLWQRQGVIAPSYSALDVTWKTAPGIHTSEDIAIIQEGNGYRVLACRDLLCGDAFTWKAQDILSVTRLPKGQFYFRATKIPDEGLLLRLLPLTLDGLFGSKVRAYHLTPKQPEATLSCEGVAGMFFMLFKSSATCSETRQPFCPENAPWGVDIFARPIDEQTGKVLHGRQVMPVDQSLDGRLFIFPQGVSGTELPDVSRFMPFELGDDEGPMVRNRVDMLRCVIKLENGE